MDTMERIEALESKSPPRWRNAAIAIAALVMVFAVAAVGLFAARDDSPVAGADALPTITFDGETASYRGPSTFDDNLVTFRLENNSDTIRAAFGWNLLNDESLTMEDLIAFSETYRGDNYIIPDWVEGYNLIDFYVPPNTVVEESSPEKLPTGKCTLYVWDPREAILYPAALVTVDPGRVES